MTGAGVKLAHRNFINRREKIGIGEYSNMWVLIVL